MLLPPSPSPNSSVPQHFCLLCQVPQTSASSTPALMLKNVFGKSLWPEWLSPPQTYSSLFWSRPSRTPLPAQRSLWTSIPMTSIQIFAFLCFPFHCTRLWQSLKRSLTVSDSVFPLSVYPCLQWLPPSLFHILSAAGAQVSHLFSSSQPMTTSWTSPLGSHGTCFYS